MTNEEKAALDALVAWRGKISTNSSDYAAGVIGLRFIADALIASRKPKPEEVFWKAAMEKHEGSGFCDREDAKTCSGNSRCNCRKAIAAGLAAVKAMPE